MTQLGGLLALAMIGWSVLYLSVMFLAADWGNEWAERRDLLRACNEEPPPESS